MSSSDRSSSAKIKGGAHREIGKVGNPGWKKGMISPNPNGRPRGIVDRRMRANQAILDSVKDVIDVVIENALAGDNAAASLLLSKVMPSVRAQSEMVEFEFDSGDSLANQISSVLGAIAAAKIAPDVGRQIIDTLAALSSVRQSEEIEARIEALERGR